MNSKIALTVGIFALVFLACAPLPAEGDCCYSAINGVCPDCTLKQPGQWYCGAGAEGCNAIGCNCDGGCLSGDCGRKKRSVDDEGVGNATHPDHTESLTGQEVVRLADADGDGALDAREVRVFLTSRGVVVEIDAWRTLDANGDGKLAPHEIDDEQVETS